MKAAGLFTLLPSGGRQDQVRKQCFLTFFVSRRNSMKPMARPLLAAILVAGPAFLAAPDTASAQIESREGIALQNQILELRQQLQELGSQGRGNIVTTAPVQSQGNVNGDLLAQLLQRVQTLEEQVRTVQGRIDDLDNRMKTQSDELAKQMEDLKYQLGGANGSNAPLAAPRASGAQSAESRPVTAPPPQTVAPAPTPQLSLQAGYSALARRDYAAAEAAAQQILSNPRHPHAYDAQYLLAQALAGRRDWQQAALTYDTVYKRNKTGAHAAESLLGLANALGAINEKPAACATIAKLQKEFPSAATGTNVKAARLRYGCS
ncbi:Hypothetical protein GbCGDNIH1_1108 [Granulibacter bethesdensis CGDNIH1]|uniref:Cell division coordinator CpoB n=2 Tax=Granulibacter bethesdensis TaxID=364410 RepID=Q0BT46_GRABC|nr:Hypothetical protein GbCGDNIH1_1108 [Granulibacter bethesdensis CGDNIH1]APH51826.1 Hypothetical protein GbCGDNIH5_1108 [Granulibacter bethesdensis]APH64517.1 Hypothetical protein GbCGDNIH1I4_1108 [Granulibacter bethesdensis]